MKYAVLIDGGFVRRKLGTREHPLTFEGVTDFLEEGDSDFVPAMKFARREGAQIFLVTLGHSVREEMLEHADLRLELARSDVAAKQERQTVRAA